MFSTFHHWTAVFVLSLHMAHTVVGCSWHQSCGSHAACIHDSGSGGCDTGEQHGAERHRQPRCHGLAEDEHVHRKAGQTTEIRHEIAASSHRTPPTDLRPRTQDSCQLADCDHGDDFAPYHLPHSCHCGGVACIYLAPIKMTIDQLELLDGCEAGTVAGETLMARFDSRDIECVVSNRCWRPLAQVWRL